MLTTEMPVLEVLDTHPKIKISDVLKEVGLDAEHVAPRIVERLELLNEVTKTVEDGENAVQIAKSIFEYYVQNKPEKVFTELEQKVVIIGSLFSDVGKTGPREATRDEQRLVVDMFAVENVQDPQMTVADFFQMYFPADAEVRIEKFEEMELNSEMSMRNFWNMHSQWTLEIISGDGIPAEAVAGAASHHIVDGVNPMNIIGEDRRFTRYFGENAEFDRAEKLIIILDKYDAFWRRSGRTKEEAIELLRLIIGRNAMFANDEQFKELIDDLAQVVLSEAVKPVMG
ncbi:MAG: hypothetical protein V4690_01365 [Patescibacteria group bacterium]